MTQPAENTAHVSSAERGVVRIFRCDYQLRLEIEHFGTYDRFCQSLGIDRIDPGHIQQVQVQALGDMSLTRFLAEGYDVRSDDLAKYASALDALNGQDVLLLILRSPAFIDKPVTLRTQGEADLVATLREEGSPVVFEELPNPIRSSAPADLPAKRPSDAAMSGRIATLALLFLFALVGAMIWIGG